MVDLAAADQGSFGSDAYMPGLVNSQSIQISAPNGFFGTKPLLPNQCPRRHIFEPIHTVDPIPAATQLL